MKVSKKSVYTITKAKDLRVIVVANLENVREIIHSLKVYDKYEMKGYGPGWNMFHIGLMLKEGGDVELIQGNKVAIRITKTKVFS